MLEHARWEWFRLIAILRRECNRDTIVPFYHKIRAYLNSKVVSPIRYSLSLLHQYQSLEFITRLMLMLKNSMIDGYNNVINS